MVSPCFVIFKVRLATATHLESLSNTIRHLFTDPIVGPKFTALSRAAKPLQQGTNAMLDERVIAWHKLAAQQLT
jgi:hypothetical protein